MSSFESLDTVGFDEAFGTTGGGIFSEEVGDVKLVDDRVHGNILRVSGHGPIRGKVLEPHTRYGCHACWRRVK